VKLIACKLLHKGSGPQCPSVATVTSCVLSTELNLRLKAIAITIAIFSDVELYNSIPASTFRRNMQHPSSGWNTFPFIAERR
jgi:hypothetical protein